MDLSAINPVLLIASLMVAATPILLAAIGELVVEKAGVLNLGVEGMMITGAVCGFAAAVETGSPALGFLGAALGGMALGLVFGVLTQFLLSNQVATGLALTLFGLGLSALLGQGYIGVKAPLTPRLDLGPLTDLPVVGRILFGHDLMVYVGLAAGRRCLVVPAPHPRRPGPARGGREPRRRPRARLPRHRHPPCRHRLRRRLRRASAAPISASCACRNGPRA